MAGNATDLIIRLLVEDKDLDKVDQSKAKFDSWNDALGAGSKVAAGTLLAIGGAAVGSSIAFANAEAGVDRLAGTLALTEPEAARAGEAAGNAYANNFGGSLEEVQAATAGVIGSIAGMREASVDELQQITEQVLTISGGFEIEADRISQVVGQMLTTGLASSAQEGVDLLTAALQRVPPAVRDDLLDAVDEYGPFFQQLGISGDVAFSMLADASAKGMYGIDKTGDALKEFTIRATDMSTASGAAYAALGMSQEDMTNRILAGGDSASQAFAEIIQGLQSITDPAAQSQAALALFGTPLEDLGTGEIPKFIGQLASMQGSLGDVSGAAERMADTVSGNPAAVWGTIRREVEMTAVELGSSLAPMIDVVLGALKDFSGWARENTGAVQALAVGATVLATAVLAASAAFKGMMFIQAITTTLGILKGAQTAAAAATTVQTAAQLANNAAWYASPVTWIVAAIIVAIGLLVVAALWLWQNWGSVTQWIGDAWNWLWGNVLSPVFTAIGAVFTWIYQNIILPVVTGIMLYIGLWAAVITWLWETVVSPVLGWIGAGFAWLYDNAIKPVVDWISSSLNLLGLAVQILWATYVQPALNAIGAGFQWVNASIIQPTISAIVGAVTWIGNTVRDVFGAIAGFMSNAFQSALGAVRGPVNGIIALVNSAIRSLNSLSVTIPSWVPIVGGQTWSLGIPQIPYLATGGVTMGPMLAVIGDNPGGQEMVQPLSMYQSSLERVAVASARGGDGGGGDVRVEIVNKTGVALGDLIDVAIERAGRKTRVALETGVRKG